MALRLSTKFRNSMLDASGGKSFGELMAGGILQFFSGSQPATGDTAASGTLLATIYPMGVDPTAPATVTFTNATNKCNWASHGLSNNQPVVFTTSGTLPAEIVSGTIYYVLNKGTNDFEVSATVGGAAVDITGDGTATITCSPAGLVFAAAAAAGTLSKHASHTWSGLGVAAGTIGWARFMSFMTNMSTTKANALLVDAGPTYSRFDMSVGTSGADLNLSSLTVAVSATVTVDTFDFTLATN